MVTDDVALMRSLTEEQQRMGLLLRKEFERDGIHLSSHDRQRVISLQNDLTQLSMEFQQISFIARDYVEVCVCILIE